MESLFQRRIMAKLVQNFNCFENVFEKWQTRERPIYMSLYVCLKYKSCVPQQKLSCSQRASVLPQAAGCSNEQKAAPSTTSRERTVVHMEQRSRAKKSRMGLMRRWLVGGWVTVLRHPGVTRPYLIGLKVLQGQRTAAGSGSC